MLDGVRLFSACIGCLLPLPGLLSIMMVWVVLLWTLWFGLRVVSPKRRRVVHAVRDRAFLPGPAGTRDGERGAAAVPRALLTMMLSYGRIL